MTSNATQELQRIPGVGKTIAQYFVEVGIQSVYYASTHEPDPERLKWWNWKDQEISG
jgi:hypothetical protein